MVSIAPLEFGETMGYSPDMLDDVKPTSLPFHAGALPEASSSSVASRLVPARNEGLNGQDMEGGRVKTASLSDPDLERQDAEISRAMTMEERLEVCLELSEFCMELNRATLGSRPIRDRARARVRD